jgi:virulence-associated protein VagC
MKTEITFVDGGSETFELPAAVAMNDHGVEVTERDGDEVLRVLFPWNRIERVTQRGAEVTAIYTY